MAESVGKVEPTPVFGVEVNIAEHGCIAGDEVGERDDSIG